MSWQLQSINESKSPQPGGDNVDDFIRRNVMMAKLEDMFPGGERIQSGPLTLVFPAAMWKWLPPLPAVMTWPALVLR